MISSFSAAAYLIVVAPSPGHAFFEQPVLEREIGHRLLQGRRLGTQLLHLGAGRLRRCRPPGAACRLQELLRPAVVQALRDTLAPAMLGDAVLAAQPGEHDPDLLLRRMLLPGRPADVLHHLLGGGSLRHGFLAHLHSLAVTMSQKPPLLNHLKPSHGR